MDKQRKGEHKNKLVEDLEAKIAALEVVKVSQQEAANKLVEDTQEAIDVLTIQRDALKDFKIK